MNLYFSLPIELKIMIGEQREFGFKKRVDLLEKKLKKHFKIKKSVIHINSLQDIPDVIEIYLPPDECFAFNKNHFIYFTKISLNK